MNPTKYLFPLAVAAFAVCLGVAPGVQAGPAPEKAAYLGVAVAAVDDTLRDQLKLSRGVGLSVQQVVADSPAEKAGVKPHDLLEKVNDQLLFNAPQLTDLVRSLSPGEKVTVTLIRQGSRQTLEATLGETEVSEPSKSLLSVWEGASGAARIGGLFNRHFEKALEQYPGAKARGKPTTFLGVELASVAAALAAQLGLEDETGALVNLVVEDSPAAKAGLKPHDVIAKLDGRVVKGPADLSTRIREHRKGDKVTLGVLRAGKPVEIEATLAEKASTDLDPMPKLLEEYRVVPRVRVLRGTAGGGEVVMHLDSGGEADGARIERRVIVHSTEPGKADEVRLESAPGAKAGHGTSERKVIVIKTDEGLTTTVRDEDGKRQVTVKDAQDKILFDGPVQSPEDRQKLPREVRESLEKIEKKVQTELGSEGKGAIHELRFSTAPSTPEVI
jgi:membrane-associated protease RseP (regulator of RpoE activity)